ncbi:MAG: apolipoprotein N-acyltransferase [Burkholderiaceae bacterium]
MRAEIARPWPRAVDALVAAAAGAAQTLAIAVTSSWPLQLAAVAVLAWRVRQARPMRAALLGLAFGSAWLGTAVWWLFISMHRYGHLPALMSAAAVALLALALALYLALGLALAARWRTGRAGLDGAAFVAAWVGAEWARTVLFTGFPWAGAGYAHVDSPLAALAPWVGVLGIGAAAAALGVALSRPRQRPAAALLALGVLALLALLPRPDFTAATGTLRVNLVQTNVAQDEKFAAERMPATLAWLAETLKATSGDLVVAPETAVPLLPQQLKEFVPDYWPALQARFDRNDQAALLGVPLGDYERGYTNSVVALTARGTAPYRYDKVHLVPFGEFIPTGFRWFTTLMDIPLGDFARGPRDAPSFAFRGERIAPNICYEDLFGEELALRFADAARAPTIMANVSNIGWFGDTVAVQQHLQISRLRALEFQRPMLRATNTGATAIVDHQGRVSAMLAPFTRGVLDGTVQGRSGLTPYAFWVSRLGLWPWPLAVALVFGLGAWASRRARGAPAAGASAPGGRGHDP